MQPKPPKDPQTLFNSQAAAQVRGAATYHAQATFGLRLGAGIIDGSLTLALFFLVHRALKLSPVPSAAWAIAVLALLALTVAAQRAWRGQTLGDRAWKLRSDLPGLRQPLLKPTRLSSGELSFGGLLTAAALFASAWSIDLAIFRQPLWARAETLELSAFFPDLAAQSETQWEVLPFFFTLGAWPKSYSNKPVFYTLPYEKGPPKLFVGHLTARWDAPDTRVTFEGPKTPQAPAVTQKEGGDRTPRQNIRSCLLGETYSSDCMKIRESTLLRHLNDMQQRLSGKSGGDTALRMKWRLRWFNVKNPALPPSEQAQGIYLSAQTDEKAAGESRGEERYILITENGTHQAIWLDYAHPGSPEAASARKTFELAVRSLRASDELGPGRAWIDRQLEGVRLQGAEGAEPLSLSTLARAQSLLLAKITVQPAVFDAYFLLGLTASHLDRLARHGSSAGQLEGLELSAIAKPLLQSAYRFAQDVAPQDSRTTVLQGYLLEAQKP